MPGSVTEGAKSHSSEGTSGKQHIDEKSPTMWIITENNMYAKALLLYAI